MRVPDDRLPRVDGWREIVPASMGRVQDQPGTKLVVKYDRPPRIGGISGIVPASIGRGEDHPGYTLEVHFDRLPRIDARMGIVPASIGHLIQLPQHCSLSDGTGHGAQCTLHSLEPRSRFPRPVAHTDPRNQNMMGSHFRDPKDHRGWE